MADITFIIAPIGGGKSLYSTRAICLELQRTDRMIVTNVPIFTGEARDGMMTIEEWAHEYVDRPIDIRKRFRLLEREEVFEFWRHLPGRSLENVTRARPGNEAETVPDLDSRQGDGGCLFVIDEVHLYFAARDWTKIGNKVEAYMSQLRKLNDDLFLVTQHPEKVDKNFRRNATEWIYLENMGKKRLFAGVTLPRRFRFHVYSQMPLRNDKPSQSGWLQLEDKEFHKVYDTMAGVGLSGKLNPEGQRTKGRHWAVWAILLVALAVVGYSIPHLLSFFAGKGVASIVGQFQKGVGNLDKRLPTSIGSTNPVPPPSVSPAPAKSALTNRVDDPDEVFMTGYVHFGEHWMATLSDGRILESTDIRFERLTPEGVKYDGKYFRKVLFGRSVWGKGKEVTEHSDPVQSNAPAPSVFHGAEVPARAGGPEILSNRRYIIHSGEQTYILEPGSAGSRESQ